MPTIVTTQEWIEKYEQRKPIHGICFRCGVPKADNPRIYCDECTERRRPRMSSIVLLVVDGKNVAVYRDDLTSEIGLTYRWPLAAIKKARKLREKGKREEGIILYRVRVHDMETF